MAKWGHTFKAFIIIFDKKNIFAIAILQDTFIDIKDI